MQLLLPEDTIDELNARFEHQPPQDIVRWAIHESGLERVCVASAFQAEGTCVIHMAVQTKPDIPVLFLETGFHFKETLAFKDRMREHLKLNVMELRGEHTPESQAAAFGERLYERDPSKCCELNKVAPFRGALRGFDVWMTGLRRDSSPTRAGTPFVEQYEMEPGKTLVKFNPLANWTREEVATYLRENDLPRNPLYDLGYVQVGCAPCTRAAFAGEGERESRWDGSQKLECGIHMGEAAAGSAAATPTA